MPYNKMGGVFYAETRDWKQRRVMLMKLKVPMMFLQLQMTKLVLHRKPRSSLEEAPA